MSDDEQRRIRSDSALAFEPIVPAAAPGRSPATSRLSPSASAVATQVMRLMRKAERDGNGVEAGADVAVARASSSSGQALPSDVRSRFEGSLGADLSSVRVHTGSASAEAASAVGARAYTTGQDIHFGAGQYAPSDPFGVHLLAHEVAHTVQQTGSAPTTQYKLDVSTPGDALEHEADRAADAMVRGAPASVSSAAATLHRSVAEDMANDKNMMAWAGDTAAQQGKSARTMRVMGSSAVGDLSTARAIIAKIKSSGITDDSSVDLSDHARTNASTRIALEEYCASLDTTDFAAGNFKSLYLLAKQDYGRVMAMAGSVQDAAGVDQNQQSVSNGLDMVANKDIQTSLVNQPVWASYRDARNNLEGAKSAIKAGETNVKLHSTSLARFNAQVQAVNAEKDAGSAAAHIQEIKNQCAATAQWAVTAVTTVSGLVGPLAGLAMGDGAVLDVVQGLASDPKKTMESVKKIGEVIKGPGGGGEGGGGGPGNETGITGLLSADPTKVLTTILEHIKAPQINAARAQYAQAELEAGVAKARDSALALDQVKTALETALGELAARVSRMAVAKNQLQTAETNLVQFAIKDKHDPNAGVAVRFMGAADRFCEQADIAIHTGELEQKSKEEAMAKRDAISKRTGYDYDKWQAHRSMSYFVNSSEGVERHDVELAGDAFVKDWVARGVGLAEGGPTVARNSSLEGTAQDNIDSGITDLRTSVATVGAFRAKMQEKLGLGVAQASTTYSANVGTN